MKKFVTYEEREWIPQEGIYYVARSKRTYTKEKYLSAVISDLSDVTIHLDTETQRLLQDTIEELSKLDGFLKDKGLFFPMLLLRTEALSSSQIEHYNSSNRNIALAQLHHHKNKQANIISANLNALIQSLYQTETISLESILKVHHSLLFDSNPEEAGKIRDVPNWIGQSQVSPQEADYVPPYPTYLELNLKQLFQFVQRTDLHPLVVASFAHAYFESIHPFSDGNGRTGRVLIQMILHHSGFLDYVTIPISVGLVKNPNNYVNALNVFREGNYNEIIIQICQAALNVVPKVYHALNEIQNIKVSWIQKINTRSDSFIWKIIDEIIAQPVIDISYLVQKFNMNDQAARNNVDILLNQNILSKMNDSKRNVVYFSKEILDVIDSFVI